MIDAADIPRLRALGVVANMQPLRARCEPSVTDVALPMIGAARGRWMYPWRSIVLLTLLGGREVHRAESFAG